MAAGEELISLDNRMSRAHLCGMRFALFAAATLILVTSATAEDGESFPRAIQGTWADSRATCGAKAADTLKGDARMLISITADGIRGSTSGTFVKPWNARGAFATNPDNPSGPPILFELEKDGRLSETVEGARASNFYVRCR